MYVALTFAGSDPSGGAGIQADLRTFTSLGVYGLSVVSSLTVQNTCGVSGTEEIAEGVISRQMEHLLSDISIHALKSGMLYSEGAVSVLCEGLKKIPEVPYVMDPVLQASDGTRLLRPEAMRRLVEQLLPLATLVTPNLHEAGLLTGKPVGNQEQMREAARIVHGMGPRGVLIKGGHLEGDAVDLFFDGSRFEAFRGERVTNRKIHGAGCVFSAAITAELAKGRSLLESIAQAKSFITRAIEQSRFLGHGSQVLFIPPALYK
ncbi:MAG: bifunctional hydroxymethylpyrimidine kinase/phosphomethylpyrimidine kinase [Nitrospirae bacterium]|nr:bifunctional hydroxymethylpyrimidine kinase/phosphomethylpyrimidine kinase [Nitrospirota bacterium]